MARIYFAASYGERYSDPMCTLVALESNRFDIVGSSGIGARLMAEVERYAEVDAEEYANNCDIEHDDFGFNNSRKALATYLACQETTTKLRRMFTPAQLETIREFDN